jgi:ubiquinone/menaquinone biosynthesis C-methylase UbiE
LVRPPGFGPANGFLGNRQRRNLMAHHHVCPWWIGYLLASPLRKIYWDPEKILGEHVQEGMRVLEIGPGMGFFTLPMARMAGGKGTVIAVDIQRKMLANLEKRAARAKIPNIECRLCTADSLGIEDLKGSVDFVLAFAVVHEVPDHARLFRQLYDALKPGGTVLMSDPASRFPVDEFEQAVDAAVIAGFRKTGAPDIRKSVSALLVKKA